MNYLINDMVFSVSTIKSAIIYYMRNKIKMGEY